ncbi:hypothetical protein RFI_25373 [Reticulomyxa filosa]|uniref:Uncharacterized protein n=1 Tax=Reticulomyxa filosa TaxID=46433 RepID=X6MDA6_RETFI|nr:hypothetical protein RFI_25373 [Reticulomyxa filosa]|eukprot:ETO12003.1 hypothetical protein RFI_25373 [Reticulomyxa filosa]
MCQRLGYTRGDVEAAVQKGHKLLTNGKYRAMEKWAQLRDAAICYHLHFDKKYYLMKLSKLKDSQYQRPVDHDFVRWYTHTQTQNQLLYHRGQVHSSGHYNAKSDHSPKTRSGPMDNFVQSFNANVNANTIATRPSMMMMTTTTTTTTTTTYHSDYKLKWRMGLWTSERPFLFMRHLLESLKLIDMEWYHESLYCVYARTKIPPNNCSPRKQTTKRKTKLIDNSPIETNDELASPRLSETRSSSGASQTLVATKQPQSPLSFDLIQLKLQLYSPRLPLPSQILSEHTKGFFFFLFV